MVASHESTLPIVRRTGSLALAALLVGAPVACSDAPDPLDAAPAAAEASTAAFRWFEDELPEVPMREYPHVPSAQRNAAIELVPDMVIGERTGQPEYAFGEAAPTIALHDDGRIFVYDASNYRIKVFGPDGTYRYGFGSRGEGPGELNRARRSPIGFVGDRFFVFANYRQLAFFTPAGEFLEPGRSRVDEDQMFGLEDGTLVGTDFRRDPARPMEARTVTLARFAFADDGLRETQVYARMPAWARPTFTADRTGATYATAINGRVTEIVAFAPDGEVRWVTRFRWPESETIMPSDLMLDGDGQLFVLPRVNRIERPTQPVHRPIEVISTGGELIGSGTILDFRPGIGWQKARDGFIYGVQDNADTFEWEVVRYRAVLPF